MESQPGEKSEVSEAAVVEAVGERIRELESQPAETTSVGKNGKELPFESLEAQEEKVIRNPEYLRFLNKLDQEYIDERLDKEGMVRVRDVAVMSIDIAGFSDLAQEALKISWGDYEGSHAA